MGKRIAYNALHIGTSAGIGRHAYELIKNVLILDPPFDFLIIVDNVHKDNFIKYLRKRDSLLVVSEVRNGKQRIFLEQIYFYFKLHQVSLFHNPDFAVSLFLKTPTIITIHDLAFFNTSAAYTLGSRIWRHTYFKFSAYRAKRIVCISNFTASEVIKSFNISRSKIAIIHNGVDFNNIDSPYSKELLFNDFSINTQYILCVGTVEPRKNLVNIFRAFKIFKKYFPNIKLVVAGNLGWLYKPIFHEVKKLSLEKDVIFTGFVSDDQLKALYSHALFLAYIPLYEGFGFPPLEAMSHNTPVLLSDIPPLHEVAGNAAIYVNPQNPTAIAEKMNLLAQNLSLRKKIQRMGESQVQQFNWKDSAMKMISVYEEILN